MERFVIIALGTALSLTVQVPSVAEAAVSSDIDAWQFEITPYLLASGLKGQAGVRGVTADVDMSFSDIWDNMDSAFMGLFTGRMVGGATAWRACKSK